MSNYALIMKKLSNNQTIVNQGLETNSMQLPCNPSPEMTPDEMLQLFNSLVANHQLTPQGR